MTITVGIDVGATYTKTVVLDGEQQEIVGKSVVTTGFKPGEAAEAGFALALAEAGVDRSQVEYVVATGYGRFQVPFSQLSVTELTAAAWGAHKLFPGTNTILDVGGQAVKASRVDDASQVTSFRLNEKCAAGTGAFLEKTARYMGFETQQIGPLASTSTQAVPISGVCTVFAEAEVINHLSQGIPPADIMHGAMISLVGKSVQLLKRVKMAPEYTLIGGIMRYPTMVSAVQEALKVEVNVPRDELAQLVPALGAAILARRRLEKAGTRAEGAEEPQNRGTPKPSGADSAVGARGNQMQSAQEYPAGQGCPQLSERQAVAAPGGGDNELSGWEARLQAPAARVAEFVELYSSLGYEVTTASIAPSSFSPECASCASMCEPDVIVYTRRPARADDSHTRQGQAPLEVPGEQ